jgi:branched-chain amino acid aminotransferase
MEAMNIDWKNLPFGYYKTRYNVRAWFRDGKWSELEVSESEEVNMHMAATALHYGQEAFEGMKAFTGKDGQIRIFRWDENCSRLQHSARGVMMEEVPEDLFKEAITKVVQLNREFVPPYRFGSAFYLRPLLIGTGPQVGIQPAKEYLFIVFGTPVGPYFREGFNPVSIQIARDFDRAAPLGTGTFKVGGNYAASLKALKRGRDEGYSSVLFLDAKEKRYLDECGPANFFGIKNNTYITPESTSILASITNKSLITLAKDMGLQVERRRVPVEELSTFEEVGACGTAAVISPIGKIVDRDTGHEYHYCPDGKPGPWTKKLYQTLTGIQLGEVEDTHGWNLIVE